MASKPNPPDFGKLPGETTEAYLLRQIKVTYQGQVLPYTLEVTDPNDAEYFLNLKLKVGTP